jgi:CheY-like chemotaxis protein
MKAREKFSILLVDNDSMVVRILSRILADFAPLRFATSGRAALKLARAFESLGVAVRSSKDRTRLEEMLEAAQRQGHSAASASHPNRRSPETRCPPRWPSRSRATVTLSLQIEPAAASG